MNSRPNKSPLSKTRRKAARGVHAASPPASTGDVKPGRGSRQSTRGSGLKAALPTQLERDTLLTPEWVAESVVQEVERFLNANLPEDFAERLAAKAHHLYPRHKHFHQGLNRPGNRGRENLLMFMRHWTAGWLKRAHSPLYKKLPWSFGLGQRLAAPPTAQVA